jgi:transcriptional regulator with GAF, ATPase, and Fis domain
VTLAAGDSLTRVLPELVGKIATYLEAEVGVVLLHNPEKSALEVVSPIWAAGHTLDVTGYLLPLRRRGDIEQTFVSGQARAFTQQDGKTTNHLLTELGVDYAVAVPLKVEHRTMGVMMVADRVDRTPFTDDDLDVLASRRTRAGAPRQVRGGSRNGETDGRTRSTEVGLRVRRFS